MSPNRQQATQPASQPVHLCGHEIRGGGHICAFFDSHDDKYRVLAPYFAEGITNGDRVINVVDARDRDAHVRALEKAKVPISQAISRDQFRLLTAEETYLKDGAVDLDAMLELVREALETSQILRARMIAVRRAKRFPDRLPNAVLEFGVRRSRYR